MENRTFILKDLKDALHVFIRSSIPTGVLQPKGSYKVAEKTEKDFIVNIGTRKVKVSIDRKSAYTLGHESDNEPIQASNEVDQVKK